MLDTQRFQLRRLRAPHGLRRAFHDGRLVRVCCQASGRQRPDRDRPVQVSRRSPTDTRSRRPRGEIDSLQGRARHGVWSGPIFEALGVPLPIKAGPAPRRDLSDGPKSSRGTRPVVFDFVRSAYYKPEGQNLLFVGSMEAELDESSPAADPDNYDAGCHLRGDREVLGLDLGGLPVMADEGHVTSAATAGSTTTRPTSSRSSTSSPTMATLASTAWSGSAGTDSSSVLSSAG